MWATISSRMCTPRTIIARQTLLPLPRRCWPKECEHVTIRTKTGNCSHHHFGAHISFRRMTSRRCGWKSSESTRNCVYQMSNRWPYIPLTIRTNASAKKCASTDSIRANQSVFPNSSRSPSKFSSCFASRCTGRRYKLY